MSAHETAVKAAAKKLSDVMGAGEDWSPLARAVVIAFLRECEMVDDRSAYWGDYRDILIRELEEGR